METNKILLNVSDLDKIEAYKKLGVSNFLFPFKGYSVGYKSFTLQDINKIDGNNYLLVNRVLTDTDIDEFLKLELPSNIKGIILEDTGLYYALKDTNLELINFQNHLNNNYKTINYWLDRFDSVVMSTDITLEEIEEILKNVKKPIILYTFGYPMIMYSRRTLVSNYYKYRDREPKDNIDITIQNNENTFNLRENEYGTSVFTKHLLDAKEEFKSLDDKKIKFYLFDTNFISDKDIEKSLKGELVDGSNTGFLHRSTIYRIGDLK